LNKNGEIRQRNAAGKDFTDLVFEDVSITMLIIKEEMLGPFYFKGHTCLLGLKG
jgi:acyl-CoA reductase-like NAD-dependent aldehyde dehydrogenase